MLESGPFNTKVAVTATTTNNTKACIFANYADDVPRDGHSIASLARPC